MEEMDAGQLDQRVQIVRETAGPANEFGEPGTPVVESVPRFAKVEPLSGRELELAAQTVAEATHRFKFRQPVDIVLTDKIEWQAKRFEVHQVLMPPRQLYAMVLASETK